LGVPVRGAAVQALSDGPSRERAGGGSVIVRVLAVAMALIVYVVVWNMVSLTLQERADRKSRGMP
jgi:hypothetical protein